MKKLLISACVLLAGFFTACDDDLDLVIPHANNITFSELQIPTRFSHVVPDGGFTVQGIHFNTVKAADGQLASGFCYSNRSYRSFTWTGTTQAVDSIRYSVYTSAPNNTGTYLVCHAEGDGAFFTLDAPRTLDYVLVSNTTWCHWAMSVGDTYGSEEKPKVNPNIPSKPKGVWHTYVPGGVKKFAEKDYFTLTVKGFKGNKETGTIDFDLACGKGHNTEHPNWNYIVNDWRKLELSSLGEVDKVVFYLDSSDKNEQNKMRTPAWFCLDGFKFK